MTYSLRERLAFSRGTREKTDLETIQRMIPGCVSVIKTNEDQDKTGIDYVVTLRRGAEILIDAKARDVGASQWWRNGPELALEIWSVMPGGKYETPPERQKIGWTLNEASSVDMVLFTFDEQDSNDVFLIPFQSLRMAFIKYFFVWKAKYKTDIQDSESWQSKCVFVPASVVLDAIIEASCGQLPPW